MLDGSDYARFLNGLNLETGVGFCAYSGCRVIAEDDWHTTNVERKVFLVFIHVCCLVHLSPFLS